MSNRNRVLTDQDKIDVVSLYKSGSTTVELAKRYGVHYVSICGILDRRGVPRRQRKYSVDERFFDYIDNEEKAYWLGFLFADGNVSGTTVTIDLNEKDVLHLRKFTQTILSNRPLEFRPSKKSWRARIHSKHMTESLKTLGCVERKSKIMKAPLMSDSLLPHFYRGHFDGDGCITSKMQSGKWKTWQCSISSQSSLFLGKLHEWVVETAGRKFGSFYKRGNGKCWCLDFSGKQSVLSFLGFLYGSASVFLDRKMKLYQEMI